MEIRLDQLGDPRFIWRETIEFAPDELAHDDLLDIGPIDCRGSIDVTTSGFVLRLTLAYEQTLSCVRCLGEIHSEVTPEIDFLIGIQSAEGAAEVEDEVNLEREDLGVLMLGTPLLDTRPLVVDQVQLGLPMKPLCKTDCAGLCGSCGSDLNQGACHCDAEVDPRWAALKGLAKG